MHLLSVSGGIPLVDAHAPVELEPANHCRLAKSLNCGKKTNPVNRISTLKLINLNYLI